MSDKHKNLQKRSFVRLTVIGALLIFFVALSVLTLARNSQEAKNKYDALIAVDQSGGDVEAALFDLQSYITSHMNTQIGGENGIKPPIQLAGTYNRLVTAEQERVDELNAVLYEQAQVSCEENGPAGFSGSNRLACIEAYVDENGEQAVGIDDSLYKFDFAPPFWSPDLAGFSIIISIILALVFCVDIALYFRTKHMVHMSS